MSYKLFANVQNICSEIATMEKDENPKREDRATVSDFFNGQAPYSQEEAEALGIQINVNNLFGYEHMDSARNQFLALYTTPPRLWEIELDVAPPQFKRSWEVKATKEWNRVMKETGRLKAGYDFVAGDCTMHGEGMFWMPSLTDWCPSHCSLARRLVPSGASVHKNELTHFAIISNMRFQDVLRLSDKPKKGWNAANLKALVKQVFDKPGKNGEVLTGDARASVDQNNVELMAYQRQANVLLDRAYGFYVPVVHFFQTNFDKPGHPLDCTIMAQYAINGDKQKDSVLCEVEGLYPTVDQAIFPMHMNCAIGGEALWHRVKGLGHLNYSLSWHLEVLINRCLQAAHEQNTTFFQAADAASREAMEQILLKHNGIIPEGITMVSNRVGSDFRGLLGLIQLVRQQGATNANQIAPNADQPTDLKEVQAIFQQNTVGNNQTNRVANWHDYMSRLGSIILGRFTNPLIQPCDRGYSEIMNFQAAMMRYGIPLQYLRPENARVTPARILGNGVPGKAMAAAGALMQNITQYGPEAQQEIRRDFAAAVTDDYEKAERLVPYSEQDDPDQELSAETENNVFAVQGKPMKVRDRDIDQIHIQIHFDFLARLVQRGIQEKQSSFDQEDVDAFKAGGAHVYIHIQRIGAIAPEQAKPYMEALNNIAAMGQKLANNLAQKQQAQQPSREPMSETDLAKTQLAFQALQLQIEKLDFSKDKFERQQALKEHTTAMKQIFDTEKNHRDNARNSQDLALRDVEAASTIMPQSPTITAP